ncbi:DUF7739 domain-containing protein [Streptomyces filamentosus]|uniref:DUF7739 domain-containing protein n=1 Tax=Streptomyces filamentosus TaxID=67294 RepID=UPI0037D08C5E
MTSLATTHGADFFGVDHHPVQALVSLADYARGCLSAVDREQLVALLEGAARMQPGTTRTIPAAELPALAAQLRTVARSKALRSPRLAATAALLAGAAARAASDSDSWIWTLAPSEEDR